MVGVTAQKHFSLARRVEASWWRVVFALGLNGTHYFTAQAVSSLTVPR